jgi:hypothetical protein
LRRRPNCDLAIVLRVQVIAHLHIHSRHPPRPSLLLLRPQTQNPLPQRHSVQTPIHPRHCYHNKNCKHPNKKQLTRRHRCRPNWQSLFLDSSSSSSSTSADKRWSRASRYPDAIWNRRIRIIFRPPTRYPLGGRLNAHVKNPTGI